MESSRKNGQTESEVMSRVAAAWPYVTVGLFVDAFVPLDDYRRVHQQVEAMPPSAVRYLAQSVEWKVFGVGDGPSFRGRPG